MHLKGNNFYWHYFYNGLKDITHYKNNIVHVQRTTLTHTVCKPVMGNRRGRLTKDVSNKKLREMVKCT